MKHGFIPHQRPRNNQHSWFFRVNVHQKWSKVGLLANKVMVQFFCMHAFSFTLITLKRVKISTANTIQSFWTDTILIWSRPQPHLAKKVLIHQDNARVRTCVVTMAKIHKLSYELLYYPAYSPDLDPWDYFLFPNL